jgi:transposase
VQDTELYRHLLGIEKPWSVSRVALDVKEQRVDVFVEHKPGEEFACPECGKKLGVYDHAEERTWRHLDSCQFATMLRARIPRVDCPEHGVRQAGVPWAEPRSRFTALFERFAIDVLLETDVAGAAKILGLSWDEAHHLMQRAVARGRARKPRRLARRIGIDEKAIAKRHKYLTVVSNLDTGTVEFLAEGRTKASLFSYLAPHTVAEANGIEAIAMDMWSPFFETATEWIPFAADKIVFDRYHVVQHMNQAVDQVRRAESKELWATGDATLKGTRHLWLYGKENVPESRAEQFATLQTTSLKTSRAWAIKEMLRELWNCSSREDATEFHRKWHAWASRARLPAVRKVAKMVKSHLHNILTYYAHGITNAVSEGLNSAIQTIKKRAGGYRNVENFKTAIYFHCGGLDLYPARSSGQ